VRACYRLARSERRRSAVEGDFGEIDDTFLINEDLRLLAIRDQLDRAFVRLTAEERSVLVLRYHLDLPLIEAADVLGIPLGTMKSRLNRAVKALRAAIDAEERATLPTEGIA
jgi:RNA polymerase sigma factor (sigma-70 family)